VGYGPFRDYPCLVGRTLVLAALLSLVAAVAATAAPVDDYQAVYADWRDGGITPCRFSEGELTNARAVASENPDDAYSGFPDDVDTELVRRRSGACAGRTPDSARDSSRLRAIRIVSVRGRGRASRERVVLKNTSRRTVDIGRATLRSSSRAKARLPRSVELRAGRSVTVAVGCARGKRRATVTRSAVYLCSRRALFADRGDFARLVDPTGIAVSQRGYGTRRRVARF